MNKIKEKGKINTGGRPKIEFTENQWKEFEQLCAFQCTKIEICEWFQIADKTLDRLVKEKYNLGFYEIFLKKRIRGLISLRRLQFQLAERNPGMAIFLGKNYLGQKDKQEIEQNNNAKIIFIDDVRE